MFNQTNINNLVNSFGGMMNMMQFYNQMRSQLSGNPAQQAQQAQNIIQNALNTGKINQNQFQQIYQLAQQLSQIMPH